MSRSRRWSLVLVVVAALLGVVSAVARASTTDAERVREAVDRTALDPPKGFIYEKWQGGTKVEWGSYRFPFDRDRNLSPTGVRVVAMAGKQYQRYPGRTGYFEAGTATDIDGLRPLLEVGTMLADTTRARRSGSTSEVCATFDGFRTQRAVGSVTLQGDRLRRVELRGQLADFGAGHNRIVVERIGDPPVIPPAEPVIEPSRPSGDPTIVAAPSAPAPARPGSPAPEITKDEAPDCEVGVPLADRASEAHQLIPIALLVALALWVSEFSAIRSLAVLLGAVALVIVGSVVVVQIADRAETRDMDTYERVVKATMNSARIDSATMGGGLVVINGSVAARDSSAPWKDARPALVPSERQGENVPLSVLPLLNLAGPRIGDERRLCGALPGSLIRGRGVARYRGDVLAEVVATDLQRVERMRPLSLSPSDDPVVMVKTLVPEPPEPPVLPFVRESTFCARPWIVKARESAGELPRVAGSTFLWGGLGGAYLRSRRLKRLAPDA